MLNFSDLEMTKLAAEAMGYTDDDVYSDGLDLMFRNGKQYVPLHDDAQAMALVKKFHLELTCGLHDVWIASNRGTTDYVSGNSDNLNRAICECCTNMWLARKAATNEHDTDSNR